MYLHLQQLLDAETIDTIRSDLSDATFVDGGSTATGAAKKVKHNLQLSRDHEITQRINKYLEAALHASYLFREAVVPRAVLPFLISMYEKGMKYGMHVDSPLMYVHPVQLRADLSMTVFLNDPSDYEGGELEIFEEPSSRLFKLNAGDAVIYSTTKLHRVREVTSGRRMVAVTWIQSLVKDAAQRELLLHMKNLQEILNRDKQGSEAHLLSQQLHSNMMRMWVEM